MRFVQVGYEAPIDRDVFASAFKAPYKLHGIKAPTQIVLVSEEGAAEILKFSRGETENPKRFEACGVTIIAVPNELLYRVMVLGLPNTDEGVE